ncbi:MAG: 50S ribosomal protein L11 methyltransferase, partial [Clostridiales bacterium]|nr:50S ribosomal protein L11 methyltransferase [Clostridiales bacterium]
MKWIEVCIESDIDITEEVSIILLEAGANGTQIQNPDEIKSLIDEAGATELADYGDFSQILDKYKIIAYFTTGTNLDNLKVALNEQLNNSKVAFFDTPNNSKAAFSDKMVYYNFLWREVDDSEWNGNWKKYYKSFDLTNKLRVVPSWEAEDELSPNIIIMDPGMAFGTGTHESTSLCVGIIEDRIKSGDIILDIGTGTGILSIAASKLGAEFAIAIDIDPASVKTAKQNFHH